jgi:predicted dehydrogenase
MTTRIAIIGFGKIAQDEHWPSIRANPAFELVAIAGGRDVPPAGVRYFRDHGELLAAMGSELDAVAICTPPGPRHAIAHACLHAGLDVLLEKPPTATIGALDDLIAVARAGGRSLYATWHSQHAPAVGLAAAALHGKRISSLSIDWCEDVRRWHPGQDWVFSAGGYGVFDPGINALSIVSRVVPEKLLIAQARLMTPADRQSPITAEIDFARPNGHAVFDWRPVETDRRNIRLQTEDGLIVEMGDGGDTLAIDGVRQDLAPMAEYPSIYAHFAELITARACDVDAEPLRLVADAFLVATRETVPAFHWS